MASATTAAQSRPFSPQAHQYPFERDDSLEAPRSASVAMQQPLQTIMDKISVLSFLNQKKNDKRPIAETNQPSKERLFSGNTAVKVDTNVISVEDAALLNERNLA